MAKLVVPDHGRGKMNRQEKGDPPLNPKGRPPKTLTVILNHLREKGYERVTATNVFEAYELLLGMDEKKIKEMVNDKKTPMILRVTGKALLQKQGVQMVETMLNRAHGRPKQTSDVNLKVDEVNLTEGLKEKISKYAKPPSKKPPVRRVVKGATIAKTKRKPPTKGATKDVHKGKSKG